MEAVNRLRERGRQVVVVAVGQNPEPELRRDALAFAHIPVYQWARSLAFLQEAGVRDVYMVGKVKKGVVFFTNPDAEAAAALAGLQERNDNALLEAAVARLQAAGMEVRPQTELLAPLLVGQGLLTGHQPRNPADVRLGLKVARALAGLDVGQTVVVKDGVVVAVEAADGTDATIRRGGAVAGPGTTVVKVSKPHQDWRFDIPVVGLRTLEQMVSAGAQTLALEAGKAFLIDKDRFLARAAAEGIALWGIGEDEESLPGPSGSEGPGPQ